MHDVPLFVVQLRVVQNQYAYDRSIITTINVLALIRNKKRFLTCKKRCMNISRNLLLVWSPLIKSFMQTTKVISWFQMVCNIGNIK